MSLVESATSLIAGRENVSVSLFLINQNSGCWDACRSPFPWASIQFRRYFWQSPV